VEPSFDWRIVWVGGGAAGALLMILLLHAYHRRRFYRLLEAKNRELQHLSTTDPLTQTANRRQIDRRLAEEIERSRRHGRPCTVILMDVDRFKQVNDRLGHQAGDLVIVEVAEVARRVQRLSDVLGRWGGDEFVLICPETRAGEAAAFAERLRAAVRDHAFPGGVRLTVSAGVAELDPVDTEVSLLERADAALYRAKARGRDRVEVALHKDLVVG
jgi:diguanylate cyclase (GGDEF)-like protein